MAPAYGTPPSAIIRPTNSDDLDSYELAPASDFAAVTVYGAAPSVLRREGLKGGKGRGSRLLAIGIGLAAAATAWFMWG
jgi:hypothetical protein